MTVPNQHEDDFETFVPRNVIHADIHVLSGTTKTVGEAVKELQLDRHIILKTVVMIYDSKQPILAYVLGDRKVSYRKLRRALNAKSIRLASPEEVPAITGYEAGAVPPIGHKKPIRVFMDREALKLARVVGGGGKVNRLLSVDTQDILRIMKPEIVELSE
jgi:Cys-tRNA(Pro) deacylase